MPLHCRSGDRCAQTSSLWNVFKIEDAASISKFRDVSPASSGMRAQQPTWSMLMDDQ
jgi:hypothetical protein